MLTQWATGEAVLVSAEHPQHGTEAFGVFSGFANIEAVPGQLSSAEVLDRSTGDPEQQIVRLHSKTARPPPRMEPDSGRGSPGIAVGQLHHYSETQSSFGSHGAFTQSSPCRRSDAWQTMIPRIPILDAEATVTSSESVGEAPGRAHAFQILQHPEITATAFISGSEAFGPALGFQILQHPEITATVPISGSEAFGPAIDPRTPHPTDATATPSASDSETHELRLPPLHAPLRGPEEATVTPSASENEYMAPVSDQRLPPLNANSRPPLTSTQATAVSSVSKSEYLAPAPPNDQRSFPPTSSSAAATAQPISALPIVQSFPPLVFQSESPSLANPSPGFGSFTLGAPTTLGYPFRALQQSSTFPSWDPAFRPQPAPANPSFHNAASGSTSQTSAVSSSSQTQVFLPQLNISSSQTNVTSSQGYQPAFQIPPGSTIWQPGYTASMATLPLATPVAAPPPPPRRSTTCTMRTFLSCDDGATVTHTEIAGPNDWTPMRSRNLSLPPTLTGPQPPVQSLSTPAATVTQAPMGVWYTPPGTTQSPLPGMPTWGSPYPPPPPPQPSFSSF
jgi:hypothetical protein